MNQPNTLPKAIIVDLDGTMTNYAHRAHLLNTTTRLANGRRDLAPFFDAMGDDTEHGWCRDIIDEAQAKGVKIIFLTGRPEKYRQLSEQWLTRHSITNYEVLLMRETRDFRPGAVVKAEIYRAEIEGKYDVLYAIDDNPHILRMWAQLGIRCLYCGTAEDLAGGNDVTP